MYTYIHTCLHMHIHTGADATLQLPKDLDSLASSPLPRRSCLVPTTYSSFRLCIICLNFQEVDLGFELLAFVFYLPLLHLQPSPLIFDFFLAPLQLPVCAPYLTDT